MGGVVSFVVVDNGVDDLEYGGDISIVGDYVKVMDYVGSVDESVFGVFDVDGLVNGKIGYVFGDVIGRVGFDEEIEVVGLVVIRDGGVGVDDFFGGVIGLGEMGVD